MVSPTKLPIWPNCQLFATRAQLNKDPLNPEKIIKTTNLVPELDTIELVGMLQQLWSEGCGDELSILTQLVDHVCSNPFLTMKQQHHDKSNAVLISSTVSSVILYTVHAVVKQDALTHLVEYLYASTRGSDNAQL